MNDPILQVAEFNVPMHIAKLAQSLHLERNTNLMIDCSSLSEQTLSPNALWSCSEKQITFVSLAARNKIVAAFEFSELVNKSSDIHGAALFKTAHELWRCEIGHTDSACGRFLALALDHIDIFEAAANLIRTGEQRVFDVLHSLEVTLHYVKSFSASDVVCVVEAQYAKTKGDMAAGMFYSAIEKALVFQPEVAWTLYRHVINDPSEATLNLYGTSLLAIAGTEQKEKAIEAVLSDVASENSSIVKVALWTMAWMLATSELAEHLRTRCMQTLVENCAHTATEVRQTAIRSLGRAATKHPVLRDNLLKLAITGDQVVLEVIASYLSLNFETAKLDEQLSQMVRVLSGITVGANEGLENFDWVLSTLLATAENSDLAFECITDWLILNGSKKLGDRDSIEHFSQTIYALANNPVCLAKFITRWLTADEMQLGAACGGLISQLSISRFESPVFDKSILDNMNASELKHVARRMLGYIIYEEPLLSLTFSLLDSKDAPSRIFGLIHALLCDEIGPNYVEATLVAIEKVKVNADSQVNDMLDSAHTHITQYVTAIESLPRLQELRPPLQLRREIQLRRSREMRKSMELAEEKSIMRQIAMTVPLKAGLGSFSIRNGQISDTIKMQSFSHQISLPSRSRSDPVGYAIQGHLYRNTKRGDS